MALRRLGLVGLLVSSVCVAQVARAESAQLAEAKRRIERVEYAKAAELLKQARDQRGLGHTELLEVLELQGVTSAGLGHSEEAEQYFRELVLLNPDFKLPKRWGPKIQTSFFAAKAWLDDQQPMTLSRQPPKQVDGKVVGVVVQLGPDPMKLVARVRVHYVSDGAAAATEQREVHAPATVEIAIAPSASVRWWAESLGAHDESLQSLGTADAPVIDQAEAAAPKPPSPVPLAEAPAPSPAPTQTAAPVDAVKGAPEPPLRPVAYALLGAGAASLIVGAVFTSRVASDHSKLDHPQLDDQGRVVGISQKDAQALVDQSARDAALANIFVVSGAALVAGGAGVFVYGSLNPTPAGAGGEVGVAGRW